MRRFRWIHLAWACVALLVSCPKPVDPPAGHSDAAIYVSPEGGTYTFDGGISLEVPAGAVSQRIAVSIAAIDRAESDELLQSSGLLERRLLVAIEAQPSGLTFSSPVTISAPCAPDEYGGVPYHFAFDARTKTFVPAERSAVLHGPEVSGVSFETTSFSAHLVALVGDDEFVDPCIGPDLPCHCTGVYAKETSRDYLTRVDDCQIVRVQGYSEYTLCPGRPRSEWTMEEVSDGCVPQLTLTGPQAICPDRDAEVIARVRLGPLAPRAGETVQFRVAGPASFEPEFAVTDETGSAQTVVHGLGETGTATVSAEALVTYRTSYQRVAADGYGSEEILGPEREMVVRDSAAIALREMATVTTGLSPSVLSIGDTSEITVTVLCDGDPVAGAEVTLAVSPASIGGVVPNRVTTSALGTATAVFAANSEGQATVTATYRRVPTSAATTGVTGVSVAGRVWDGTITMHYSAEPIPERCWPADDDACMGGTHIRTIDTTTVVPFVLGSAGDTLVGEGTASHSGSMTTIEEARCDVASDRYYVVTCSGASITGGSDAVNLSGYCSSYTGTCSLLMSSAAATFSIEPFHDCEQVVYWMGDVEHYDQPACIDADFGSGPVRLCNPDIGRGVYAAWVSSQLSSATRISFVQDDPVALFEGSWNGTLYDLVGNDFGPATLDFRVDLVRR